MLVEHFLYGFASHSRTAMQNLRTSPSNNAGEISAPLGAENSRLPKSRASVQGSDVSSSETERWSNLKLV